ncbi:MAG: alpha-ketoacid dehydrogenase subunit beta [Planctomycetes bacterium]|nr:alpha-ketoacid dehydrogenase subunit beta [Planctomycetota bacterium]
MPVKAPSDQVTYLEAISRALRDAMREDPSVFLLGQDVAAYGGAFKVTAGMLEDFGPERVMNTPISESGAIGVAVGAALLGRRPVVEMQFADFISCGFNQIVNVAAKMFWRTGRPVPLVIRCPAGGGAGAGAFHSQCVEAWFLHTPGLKVVAPAFPRDAYWLLRAAIRDPDPVLYFEHKQLYRRVKAPASAVFDAGGGSDGRDGHGAGGGGAAGPPPRIGQAATLREGEHVTVISYGWTAHHALEAAEKVAAEGISVEVLDLRTLAPLDEEAVLRAARKTGRVLIAHEACLSGGFGGELAARIAEKAFEHLDAPVRRLAYPDIPVPYHRALEAACLPSAEKIAQVVRELRGW